MKRIIRASKQGVIKAPIQTKENLPCFCCKGVKSKFFLRVSVIKAFPFP